MGGRWGGMEVCSDEKRREEGEEKGEEAWRVRREEKTNEEGGSVVVGQMRRVVAGGARRGVGEGSRSGGERRMSSVVEEKRGGGEERRGEGFVGKLLAKSYVLDMRLTMRIMAFLGPSLGVMGANMYMKVMGNEEGAQWMERHCTLSLQNLKEHGYHTLITSAFGGGGNTLAGGLAEVSMFLLVGGNLLRSFGLLPVFGLYLAGHILFSSSFLAMNYIHLSHINQYREKLVNPELHENLTYTPRRDRKALVLDIARQTGTLHPSQLTAAEEKQREIIRMPEGEFLDYATKYYLQRQAIPVGGGTMLTLLGLRLHPLAVIAIPYVPIPMLIFAPLQITAFLASFDTYPVQDRIIALAPVSLLALFSAFYLPRHNLLRYLPVELINQLKLPSWIPRHTPDTRLDDLKLAAAHATSLAKRIHLPQQQVSPQQIEAMRKRNAKFSSKSSK